MKVLFLCRGNTGRSTFAESLYKKLVSTEDVYSAGTKLSGPTQTLESRLPDTQFVIDAMETEGVDVSQYSRKEVTEKMVDNSDMIVNMAELDTVPSFVKAHPNVVFWNIDDPKGTDYGTHVRVKDEIKNKIIETFLS